MDGGDESISHNENLVSQLDLNDKVLALITHLSGNSNAG
jgi:hypothetical protein